MNKNEIKDIFDIELLDKQKDYKEYFFSSIFFSNIKIFLIKIMIAFLFSYIFVFFDYFVELRYLLSYFIIEVLYFNLINRKSLKP